MDPIISQALDSLVEVAVAGTVTAVGGAVVGAIRARAATGRRREALERVTRLAERAVLEQMQVRTDAARLTDADGAPVGKLGPDTARAAKSAAVDLVVELLTPVAQRALEEALGGADKLARYIGAEVEAAVARAKARPATLQQAARAAATLGPGVVSGRS